MATIPLSRERVQETINIVQKCIAEGFKTGGQYPSANGEAAKRLQTNESTIRRHLKQAAALGISISSAEPERKIELPVFPDEDIPIGQMIDYLTKRSDIRKQSYDAHEWFPIKVKEAKPIGLLFVGDVHIDDDGCDWSALRFHCNLCKNTEGMYSIAIGDQANWWGGRLIKKYADQDNSAKTARRLVEWLFLESGMRWLIWLQGNHEHMTEGSAIVGQMAKRYGTHKVAMHDWEARFVLKFPGGEEFRINCAHDFPGTSMYNPLHGTVKAVKFGNDIDLAVCGHRHNYAVAQWEQPEQGNTPLMVRVRGYKTDDAFARRIGKYEQKEGQSVLVIIDPTAKTRAGRVQAFVDIEKGARYLAWLRGDA